VDDSARVGALRLKGADGQWHRSVEPGRRTTPPLIALERAFRASHAIERGDETDEDLRYLQGRGTSLGGMRPKCTLVDESGRLAIGKFPSIGDTRSVTRGEVLALKLAQRAGIQVAESRVVQLADIPVALIYRFDRQPDGGRIPYQSAATMLQASRDDERSYLEIAEVIRRHALDPTADLQQLWRRLIFNLLITNVDDHLQNHGFLHATNGHWRLSPAFDINPFPDKDRESKVWLSEEDGPITNTRMLLARCREFALTPEAARKVLDEVRAAVAGWREVALSPEVGLTPKELRGFEGAFVAE
jgi:hipA domain protein